MTPVPAGRLAALDGSTRELVELFPGSPLVDDLHALDAQGQSVLIETIWTLCRLVPAANVASPKWSRKRPIIVLGRTQGGGRINERATEDEVQPRIGLCRDQGKLRLFVGHATIGAYCADVHIAADRLLKRTSAWDTLRDLVEGPSLEPAMLLEDEDFRTLLSWVQSKLERTDQAHRQAPDAPMAVEKTSQKDGRQTPVQVLHDVPELPGVPAALQAGRTLPGGAGPHGPSALPGRDHHRSRSARDPGSSRNFGVLFRDTAGALCTRVVDAACARNEFPRQAAQTLAIVAGTQEVASQTLQGIMGELLRAQRALEDNEALRESPAAASGGHVYVYFRDAVPVWTGVCYVGMTARDPKRGAAHLKAFLEAGREVRGPKTLEINRALRALETSVDGTITSMRQYHEAVAAGRGRRIFQHAFNSLDKVQAFMVEHYLIQRLGPYSVSNETGGNAVLQGGGYEALVLPSELAPDHRNWADAVTEFSSRGCLSSRMRSELDLASLAPVADVLNQKIQEDARLSGSLLVEEYPNYRVANGQDATLNYGIQGHDVPFRLELLASRKEPSLRVNLRPNGDPARFSAYLQARGLVVANPGSVYCKPFAPAGNGRRDVFFPARPDADGHYLSVQRPAELQWLAQGAPEEMNILDAVHAVLIGLLD